MDRRVWKSSSTLLTVAELSSVMVFDFTTPCRFPACWVS
jgi:hypothetical protein